MKFKTGVVFVFVVCMFLSSVTPSISSFRPNLRSPFGKLIEEIQTTKKKANENSEKIKINEDHIDALSVPSAEPTEIGIPILPGPPEAIPGAKYINEGSGATCYYTCVIRAGVKSCQWIPRLFLYPDDDFERAEWDSTFCKPVNYGLYRQGTPEISFEDRIIINGRPESDGIIDISTLRVGEPNSFIVYITDADNEQADRFHTLGFVYLTKISSDPSETSVWELENERIFVAQMNMSKDKTLKTQKIVFHKKSEGMLRMPTILYDEIQLEAGVYGFIVEAIDADHNRVISDLAPVKLVYDPS